MKLVCTCGISHWVMDWPAAEIEEGGKKMMERHLTCSCGREVVVRTSPKEEPTVEGDDDKPTIVSQEALAKMLGLKPPTVQQPIAAQQTTKSNQMIIVPNESSPKQGIVSMFLDQNEAETFSELARHYGEVFKPLEDQAEERQKYLDLAERGKIAGILHITDKAEASLVRCSMSDRNFNRLYPVKDFDDDGDHNVQRMAIARALKERLFKAFDGAGV